VANTAVASSSKQNFCTGDLGERRRRCAAVRMNVLVPSRTEVAPANVRIPVRARPDDGAAIAEYAVATLAAVRLAGPLVVHRNRKAGIEANDCGFLRPPQRSMLLMLLTVAVAPTKQNATAPMYVSIAGVRRSTNRPAVHDG
jgi:hypothetical protein